MLAEAPTAMTTDGVSMASSDSTRNFAPLFTWRSGVMSSDLPAMTKYVGLALSLHMNEMGGSCFPSAGRLAEETSLGRSTVWESLKKLQEAGWIVVTEHGGLKGERRRANTYQARVPIQEMDRSGPDLSRSRTVPIQEPDTSTSLRATATTCVQVVDRSKFEITPMSDEEKSAAKRRAREALSSRGWGGEN